MRKLRLPGLGNGARVDLIAATIIIILCGQKFASLVTSCACGIPLLVNIKEVFCRFRLSGTVDVDCSTIWRLAFLILRKGDVSVLFVSEGDHVSRLYG